MRLALKRPCGYRALLAVRRRLPPRPNELAHGARPMPSSSSDVTERGSNPADARSTVSDFVGGGQSRPADLEPYVRHEPQPGTGISRPSKPRGAFPEAATPAIRRRARSSTMWATGPARAGPRTPDASPRDNQGRLPTEFRLWDVQTGQEDHRAAILTPDPEQLAPGQETSSRTATLHPESPRLAGSFGTPAYDMFSFDETGPKENRLKRLAIMDQDGANVRYLTPGDNSVVTPRFLAAGAGDRLHGAGLRRAAPGAGAQPRGPGRARRWANFPNNDLVAALHAQRALDRDDAPAGRQRETST